MADFSIRLEGDTRRLLKKMKDFSELDKKKVNAVSGQVVRESTLERFKQSRDPAGKLWKTSKRAAESGGKTLVETATLRNSIHVHSDASGFAVGTNLKYAATHQFGDPGRVIRARKAKALRFQIGGKWISKKSVRIKIPARTYLGLSDDDQQEIKGTVEDFIARED
ncbi:phage virion morphogenesis protein [Oscillibacter sp.]|uniref:phage virion morphogenesis protein n=1 Tax=Oscillibacter sp. TaxID=1945593 RepID=UPI0028A6A157|nr:phage virion morphogenesis protein [Oscillibacter sp.]